MTKGKLYEEKKIIDQSLFPRSTTAMCYFSESSEGEISGAIQGLVFR